MRELVKLITIKAKRIARQVLLIKQALIVNLSLCVSECNTDEKDKHLAEFRCSRGMTEQLY